MNGKHGKNLQSAHVQIEEADAIGRVNDADVVALPVKERHDEDAGRICQQDVQSDS